MRIELEGHARDLDLVPRLKALGLERAENADPAQPALEVGHRVLVLGVKALQQQLDPPATDRESTLCEPLDAEASRSGGAEDHVLGQLRLQ